MDEGPPDGGAWFDELRLPEIGMLVAQQPPALDPDTLVQWLETAPDPPAAVHLSDPFPLKLLCSAGDSSLANTEEEQMERLRAQNRIKQSRFRQRQRERKQQLVKQCEAIAANLERERQLNANMKLSCRAMEAIRDQRDALVQVLETAAASEQPAQGQGQGQVQGSVNGCLTTSAASHGLAGQLWAMPFRDRAKFCYQLFCHTEPARKALKEHAGQHADRPDGFALHAEVREMLAGQMVTNYPELLKSVLARTSEMFRQDWAELGELAAEVIQLHDDGKITEEEAQQLISDGVMYFTIIGTIYMTHKPEVLQNLLGYCTLPGETDEQAATRWREVAIGMKFTEEQVRSLIPAFQTYCDRMQQLSTDTAAALESLHEVQQRLNEQLVEMGLSAGMQQYLRVFDVTAQLSRHSNAALLITLDFMTTTGKKVSPLQKARSFAMCRPLHPDLVSIVREALAHFGLLPACATGAALPAPWTTVAPATVGPPAALPVQQPLD